ncbi:hypothetical protein K449DRAFT_392094 [Hypoxylon sp. EC38]|nr:hypothetical protein K449DRAFT_392094 [Hypoxylon sp. EC38]
MFIRERTRTTTRRNRERRGLRRRQRQLRLANTRVDMSLESRRDQHTDDGSTRANTQCQGEPGLEITTDLSVNRRRSRQYQGIDNHEPSSMPPHDEHSEQLIYDTYLHDYASTYRVFLSQQATNDNDYPTSGGLDHRMDDHTHHTPPSQPEIQLSSLPYSNLGEYVAQQQAIRDYTLEFWRAQSLQDGPLRIVPELLDLRDCGHHLRSNYERESETAATGERTP